MVEMSISDFGGVEDDGDPYCSMESHEIRVVGKTTSANGRHHGTISRTSNPLSQLNTPIRTNRLTIHPRNRESDQRGLK